MKIEADFSRQHPNMGHDFPDASANYPTTAFQGRLVHFIYQSGNVVGLIFYHKATKERSQLGRSLATKARRHEVNGLGVWPRRHEVNGGGVWPRRHEDSQLGKEFVAKTPRQLDGVCCSYSMWKCFRNSSFLCLEMGRMALSLISTSPPLPRMYLLTQARLMRCDW
jgi:hypothetical protein